MNGQTNSEDILALARTLKGIYGDDRDSLLNDVISANYRRTFYDGCVTVVGRARRFNGEKGSGKGSVKVSWYSIGEQTPEDAKAFADAIQEACDVATLFQSFFELQETFTAEETAAVMRALGFSGTPHGWR